MLASCCYSYHLSTFRPPICRLYLFRLLRSPQAPVVSAFRLLVPGKGPGCPFPSGRPFTPGSLADSQVVEIQKDGKNEVDYWEQQWEEYLFFFFATA